MRSADPLHVIVVRFLGTGPAGGRPGHGHSCRRESSLAIISEAGTILIDVTRDAQTQLRLVDRVDLVLITHAHRDASGGLRVLDRQQPASVPVYAARDAVQRLRERHPRLAHIALHGIASGTTFSWHDWRITSLTVPHARDCTTFAWRLQHGRRSVVYASDVARLTSGLRELATDCDLLVLDGAMWQRTIFTHLEIRATARVVARWPVQRVMFTQLGRSTPDHETLAAWLFAFDPRFEPAYDGCELVLSERPDVPRRSSLARARAHRSPAAR